MSNERSRVTVDKHRRISLWLCVALSCVGCGAHPASLFIRHAQHEFNPICWQSIQSLTDASNRIEQPDCESVKLSPGRYRAVLKQRCFSFAIEFEVRADHVYGVRVCAATNYGPESIAQLQGRRVRHDSLSDMDFHEFTSELRLVDDTSGSVVGFGGPARGTYAWELLRADPYGRDSGARLTMPGADERWPCNEPLALERLTDSPYAKGSASVVVSDPHYEACFNQ